MRMDATSKHHSSPAPGRPRDPAIDKTILAAALELFLEHGAEGVNFEQISRRTQIPRTTIYRRWKTRYELLNDMLQSVRISAIRDPEAVLRISSHDFLRFLEDTIVAGLMSQVWPRLVAQLIAALASCPELLATYCRRTIEPGWKALNKAIDNAHATGAIRTRPDREILRDLLTGAIVHRLISRRHAPKENTERRWVKRLLLHVGLSNQAE